MRKEDCFSLERFFDRQLRQWPEAMQRYRDLTDVQTKELHTRQLTFMAQFNPARIRSTGASITKQALAERPCFLCKENRPKEQLSANSSLFTLHSSLFTLHSSLLVNPYPILPMHFTLPTDEHLPQRIKPLFGQMMALLQIYPELTVFYNGPRCGASAPDHAHLQAGTTGVIPLQKEWPRLSRNLKPIAQPNDDALMALVEDYPCTAIVIRTKDTKSTEQLFLELYNSLPVIEDEAEPMMNVVSWRNLEDFITVVFPRKKHRPDCYYPVVGNASKRCSDDDQLLISPGALDMAGLIITPREEDFLKLDAERAVAILKECSIERRTLNINDE